jgi:hypothetical protein
MMEIIRIRDIITGNITHLIKEQDTISINVTSPEYLEWLARDLKLSENEILKIWGIK